MTTKISTIVDNLATLVAGALPSGYARMPNPYAPPENSILIIDKGYGIAVGPAVAQPLEVGCNMHIERQFNIVISQDIGTSEHDIDARIAAEKAILEDFQSCRLALENDHTLTGQAIKVEYVGDSGIEFLATERQRYLSLNFTVQALYQESLTP